MNKLEIIAFAGLPLTGKSTLAKLLGNQLKISCLDIDEIRRLLFKYHPVDSENNRKEDEAQMWASWKSLFALTDNLVEAGESAIVAATFSRESYHRRIAEIAENHKVPLKAIFCYAPPEIIAQRIELRNQDKENPSNLRNMEGYKRVEARYVKISTPFLLDVDTSKPLEECLAQIIDFIKS